MQASASCTNNADPTACLNSALNSISIDPNVLTTQCPSCSGSLVPNPYSTCPVCVSTACAASIVAANISQANATTSGCLVGMVPDPAAPGYCNTPDCLATTNLTDALAVDRCRQAILTNNGYILMSGGQCVMRRTVGAACLNSTLEYASWDVSKPFNATYPWLGKPFCARNDYSRVNHLGNGLNGFQNGFNMSMIPVNRANCVLRTRYNITTSDYNNLDPHNSGQVNGTLNSNGEGSARILIDAYHNIPTTDSQRPWRNARDYRFRQNPQVTCDAWSVKQIGPVREPMEGIESEQRGNTNDIDRCGIWKLYVE